MKYNNSKMITLDGVPKNKRPLSYSLGPPQPKEVRKTLSGLKTIVEPATQARDSDSLETDPSICEVLS